MANSILTLFLLLAVSYMDFGVYVSGYQTTVGIYKNADGGKCSTSYGTSTFNTPGSGTTCIYYNSALWDISGIQFNHGTCAMLYDNQSCNSAKTTYVTYRSYGSCNLVPLDPLDWNDRIRSMGYCPVKSKTFTCPAGSYVRKMYIPETDDLVSGITMHCFKPSSPSDGPTARINSVGKSPQSSSNRECSFPMGARGVNLNFHSTFQFYYAIVSGGLVCGPDSPTSGMVCGPNQVLTGFTSDVEEGSGVTKGIKAICMDVLDPTPSCTPTEFDSLVNIGTCDNTDGASTKTCTISQKLGWGDPDGDRFTEAERSEKAFYSPYFSTASVPKILRNRFNSIGNSKIEGVTFNWAEHGTRSWSPLQSKTITVTIPAKTFTSFQQLKGKCGFYGVHTSYVKRIDVTTGSKPTQTVFMSGLM